MKNCGLRGPSRLCALFALLMCGFGCGDGGYSGAHTNNAGESSLDARDTAQPSPTVTNPASAHCVEQGHRLELRQGSDGQFGVCLFADGSACEEWSFFKGTCSPGTCWDKDGLCD